VADMKCAVGVREGGRDEKFARQWIAHKVMLDKLGNKGVILAVPRGLSQPHAIYSH
jgi:hypothetical protein